MKKKAFALFLLLALAASSFAETELLVSAAASLTDVLGAIEADAEKSVGAKILLNFGGSGALRKQIEEGAPADVFFSAASEDADKLEKAGLVVSGSRVDLLSNAIVLVGDAGLSPPADLDALRSLLSGASVLAVGNPASVPAGRYAAEALTSMGLYPLVEKKLALGGTVREVLQFVASGSAPLGVVFLTDAMTLKPKDGVAVLYRFPESALKTPVLYPVVIVAASKSKDKAALYIEFLKSAAAKSAFARAGFIVR